MPGRAVGADQLLFMNVRASVSPTAFALPKFSIGVARCEPWNTM